MPPETCPTPFSPDSQLIHATAACIDRLGGVEFYPRFFQLMKRLTAVNQYMVFEFSPNGEHVTCRLAHNPANPDLGVRLASQYVSEGHLQDPLLQELRQRLTEHPDEPTIALLEKRTLPPVYRREFFNLPDFDVKFSFVVIDRQSQHLFYINFYSRELSTVDPDTLSKLQQLTPLIGSLLLKHFREERRQRGAQQSLRLSGLSEREAQICELILQGHTAKSIGLTLELSESTVVTYKKRAFAKLQIGRKSELVKFV